MIENGQSTGVKFRVNRIIMKFFHVLKINTLHDRAVQLILQCDCIPFLQVTLDSLHKTKAGKVASKTARETGQVDSRQPKNQNIVFFLRLVSWDSSCSKNGDNSSLIDKRGDKDLSFMFSIYIYIIWKLLNQNIFI